MSGIVIVAAIAAWFAATVWLLVQAVDGSKIAGLVCAVAIVVPIGLLVEAAIDQSKTGPCHQYETRMMYNAATKTMMPSRVCVLRGEWVEEE